MTTEFAFWSCHEIRESLGVRADTEQALGEHLRTIDAASIYHHSIRCLLRHQVGSPAYPDDFARWVAQEVGDPELAERLALFSPFDLPTLEDFRTHLVTVIEDHVERQTHGRPPGRVPFRFLRSHLVALPIGVAADDLATLRAGLESVDDSTIYFHTVESAGRRPHGRNDFAEWVDNELGLAALADRLAAVDPFVAGLARTRGLLIDALDSHAGGQA